MVTKNSYFTSAHKNRVHASCICQSCEENGNGAVYSVGIKAAVISAIILMFMMKVMCSFQELRMAGSSVLDPASSALSSHFCPGWVFLQGKEMKKVVSRSCRLTVEPSTGACWRQSHGGGLL